MGAKLICQETVDKSPAFPEMLVDLEKWMREWDLLTEDGSLNNAVWVSDGVSPSLYRTDQADTVALGSPVS